MTKNRILNLQQSLKDTEAFWITSGSNRFYLTEFNSSAGTVLVTRTKAVFFIDFRYFEKAKHTVTSCEVVLYDKGDKGIFEFCKEENIKTIFVETANTSIGQHKYLSNLFEDIKISDDNILDTSLNIMRAVKSEKELNFICQAQSLTEQTFDYILPRISVGKTEREIMLDMEFFMRSLGASGVSFDFIVVSGNNSSLPHGVPTDKKIENGDFITMDFGAIVNGYCSDMTRTVAIGSVTDEQKFVYDTTLKAQLSAIENIKAGVVCGDIDKVARDIIYNAGYKGCFGHALGHSVGIDVHEAPNLSPNNTAVLQAGNVVTVEPGIYIENKFGVRIEDMVCVTENGCENLTKSPKELIIL
ncbi:MAG: aminopeptidase P family protein [Ruminococcaceae bacterium]|nr:aminopeptidase P family protein [Oscillospiraceae bacterium]